MTKLLAIFTLFFLFGCKTDPAKEQVSYDKGLPGRIDFSTGPVVDMGVMAVGSASSFIVNLTNSGSLPITEMTFILNEKATLKYTGDSFPGRQGDCQKALGPGESCAIELFAYSNDLLALEEVVGINYKNGISPAYTALKVNGFFGNPARLKADILSYDFGNIEPGTQTSAVVRITNEGELSAKEIAGFAVTTEGDGSEAFNFTGGDFPGVNGTCGDTLDSGDSCKVEIYGSPAADNTQYSGSLQLSYVNPSAAKTVSVPLSLFGAEYKAYIKAEVKDGALPRFEKAINNDSANAPELTFVLTNTGFANASSIALKSAGDMSTSISSNTCPAQLAPDDSCELVIAHTPAMSYPIPSDTSIPVEYDDQPVIFEYDDGKYAALAQTEGVNVSGDVILEANLLMQRNGDVDESFDPDPAPVSKTVTWPAEQFDMVVGEPITTRSLKLIAGQAGKNADLSNLTFQMLPDNNGFLTLKCLSNNNCPTQIYGGNRETLQLVYNPTAAEEKTYTLKMTYFDGVKTKDVSIDIPAKAQSIPLLAITGVDQLSQNDPYNFAFQSEGLYDEPISQTITITNNGISDFTPADHLVQDATGDHAYFSIDSSACAAPIKNGASCDVVYTFQKSGDRMQKPFTEHTHTNFFTLNNGLDSADSSYKEYKVEMTGKIIERGYYEAAAGSHDFGAVPYSTGSQTGGTNKSFKTTYTVADTDVRGSHVREHFQFDLAGEEAGLFSVSFPSGEITSVFAPGNSDPGGPDVNRDFYIHFNSPENTYDLGADGKATATLTINYHGRGQEASSADYEPETIVVNLEASPTALAWYAIQDDGYNSTNNKRMPFESELVGNNAAVVDAAAQIITIKNTGLVAANGNSYSVLEARKTDDSGADTHYKLRAVDSADACFAYHNQLNDQAIQFRINPLAECQFEIYDYAPDDYSTLLEHIKLSWHNGSASTISKESFYGVGFQLADLIYNPAKNSGLDFYPIGEKKLGQSLTPDDPFLVESAISDRFVMPGEVVSINILSSDADSADCSLPTTMPSTWEGYTAVYKPGSFAFSSNNCSGASIHPGEPAEGDPPPYFSGTQESCSVNFTFTPQHIGKVETACVELTYKKTPSESVPSGREVLILGGAGKVPETIFKGWKNLLAEGETLDENAYGEISWNEMEVENGLGSVVSYRVYRKAHSEGSFPEEYLASVGPSGYDTDCNCYKFRNTVNEESLPDASLLEPLAAEKVYDYKIMAKINVPGEGDFWSKTKVGSADEIANLYIPAAYQTLIHRWSANQISCLQYLDKTYDDLDRENHYACPYTGDLSDSGIYDLGGNLVLDKYENGEDNSGQLTHLPGVAPAKMTNLQDAKDYCSSRSLNIDDLGIFGKSMRLVDRRDYVLASYGAPTDTCVTGASSASVSGAQRCESFFGAHDMIGNRWDLVDDKLDVDSNYDWFFAAGAMFDSEYYFFDVNVLDLNSYSAIDYDTHTDYFAYDNNIGCFNLLLNRPSHTVGGICPESKGDFYFSNLSGQELADYDPAKRYIIFPQHEAELGEAFVPKRHLMMGGSYQSESRFRAPAAQRTMYWTNPEAEAVLMQNNPNGGYEGGAPRCILEFNF